MNDRQNSDTPTKSQAETRVLSGANWFFWIAGLSLVNSLVLLVGSQWNFIVGLGTTQVVDAIALELAQQFGSVWKFIGLMFNVIIAGVFCFFGVFSRKKHSWAFILGMVLYALDGLLFLLVQDFLSLGFHAFALFCIFSGLKAMREMENLQPARVAVG